MTDRIWEISDIDGSNKRTVTLAEFKAEVARKRADALAILAAACERDGLTDSPLYRRAKDGGF